MNEVRFSCTSLAVLCIALFISFLPAASAADQWYNSSWHFRQKLEFNASGFIKQEWPAEIQMNFTELLRQAGSPNTSFDNDSIRVFEYNSSGSLLNAVPYQFDTPPTYSPENNAVGELVFIINGTTHAYQQRTFYVYFDTVFNGEKPQVGYPHTIDYSWDGEEFYVNNTFFRWHIDTIRAGNTSGIYRVDGIYNPILLNTTGEVISEQEETFEHSEFTNGSSNFTYLFANNATFVNGPIRLTAILVGDEALKDDPSIATGEGRLTKKYKFYNMGSFIKIEQAFVSTAAATITRASTAAGAIAFEYERASFSEAQGNSTDPFSWYRSSAGGSYGVGFINYRENGTENFSAQTALGRVGIGLLDTELPPSGRVSHTAILDFNDTERSMAALINTSETFHDVMEIIAGAEEWKVNFTIRASHTTYNRNETVQIIANITSDPYNFTLSINATIDNGTVSPSDDFVLGLYDDGLHNDSAANDGIFGNNFTIYPGDELGSWNLSAILYGAGSLRLSANYSLFDVTDAYALNLSIIDHSGLTSRLVNMSANVRNYRGDQSIVNASFSCTYSLSSLYDYGNGTYALAFSAPSSSGNFSIECNATKGGNIGASIANFSSETGQTFASVANSPYWVTATGITLLQNYNFTIQINATNTYNGSANLANITLQLPGNWTASSLTYDCGNLSVGSTCIADFNVTVANRTMPGNYSVNATFRWRNPDNSAGSNSSSTNISVASNPLLVVSETSLYSIIGIAWEKRIGNFTLSSIGNDALANITFDVSGLLGIAFNFSPVNISVLAAGSNISVQINATVPLGHSSGDYLGHLNITTQNDGNASILLNISISGANVSVSASPANFTANNITQAQNQSFEMQLNITNLGNSTSYFTNITLQVPAGVASNSSLLQCGNLSIGSGCTAAFVITVLNATSPGTYLVNASAVWNDLEGGIRTNTTYVNISVLSNPIIEISDSVIIGNATHGNTSIAGNFTIYSRGNDALYDVSINLTGLYNFTTVLTPSNISVLAAGASQAVVINVTVPFAYDPSSENGTLNISTANAPELNATLQIDVLFDLDWLADPSYCEKTESPDAGTICEITVNNTGNAPINFTIIPSSANHTEANTTNFSIAKQSSYSFNITYNITGYPKVAYNTTYVIVAVNSGSIPANRSFVVALVPFQSLTAALAISPLVIQGNETTTFYFNITDVNLVGIKNVTAQVIFPNGTSSSINLSLTGTFYNATGNTTSWQGTYPNGTSGSTALSGNYSVLVFGFDNVEVNGTANGTFYAYPLLRSTVQSLSSSYQRGSTASIYFRSRDLGGAPLPSTNVTIWILDNSSILVFNNSYTTASSGIVEPLPTLSISPDAALGNWAMHSESAYYDSNASVFVNHSASSTFEVVPASTSGNFTFSGLLTNFQTSDLFFGGDEVQFAISVFDVNGAPLDPDDMNITIFSPNESIHSIVNFSQINRSYAGVYYHKFSVPRNITSGVYRAELNTVRGIYSNRNVALFRISGELHADVETSFVWYPNSVMTFRMIVYTGDGVPIDPTTMNLTVIDPAGNAYFSITLASMTRLSAGYYLYNHAMGVNTSVGNYYAQLYATKDAATTAKLNPFRVSQGGPYDVRFDLIEQQVYQGDYLDFTAIIENKGPVSQDVTLEYWVTDGSQTWYYGSEAVLTPAYTNSTFVRSAYIFTSQPARLYWLNGRVTYDLIKPPIDINYTFAVVARPVVIPTVAPTSAPVGPGPTGPIPTSYPSASPTAIPPFRDYSGMQIISYPDEVAMQAGEIKYPRIQIKNAGLVPLHNITITFAGIPLSWVELVPSRINALAPNDVATFVVKITAPASEKTSVRKVRAIAISAERKEEVRFDVSIFESKLSLIEHMLQRLSERVQILAKDTQEAEKAGKDVKAVWETIDQVKKYLSESENNLRSEQLDDAMSNAQIADNLLAKGVAQLISAPFLPPSYAQLPNWITLALGFVGTSMGILVFWFVRKRRKQPPEEAKQPAGVLEKVTEVLEKTDSVSLQKEKNKILRTLRLLEDELSDGTISQNAHLELRRRYERKLVELDRKLAR